MCRIGSDESGDGVGQNVEQDLLAVLPIQVLANGLDENAIHAAIAGVCRGFNVSPQAVGKSHHKLVSGAGIVIR